MARQKATKSKEWTPSAKQAQFLQAAAEVGLDRNLSKIAKEAGVARQTVYEWLDKDPDFTRVYEGMWRKILWKHLPSVVSAMVKKAQGGDIHAARLTFDLAGLLKQKLEVGGRITLEELVAASMKPGEGK